MPVPAGARFGSVEWVALVVEAYRGLPERPGATAVVDHSAPGGPAGELGWWTAFEDGRLVAAGAGHHRAPDVSMASPYRLAVDLATGREDPSVAFMQGRTKVAGDQGALLRVLATMATPAYHRATADLARRTRV